MASSSSFALRLHQPPLFSRFQNPLKLRLISFKSCETLERKRAIHCSSSSSSSSSWEREEQRWVREEQRWVREEERWVREEQRWKSEREALLREISALKFRVQTLEHRNSFDEASISSEAASSNDVDVPIEMKGIAEKSSDLVPLLLESETEEVKVVAEEKKEEKVWEEQPRDRVFLLGENRWEDSSRVGRGATAGSGGGGGGRGGGGAAATVTRCLVCRGEGRLLCEECDGTGEPNIEEQFMDWVGEGAKCPYCEGHGYNTCDVCDGKPVQIPAS